MIEKLIAGATEFHKIKSGAYSSAVAEIKRLGKKPQAMFITCIDSRLMPNMLTGTGPGDMFVVRNPANVIPPHDAIRSAYSDQSEAAALEFAILEMKIDSIIICGHSDCLAVKAAATMQCSPDAKQLRWWLRHVEPAVEAFRRGEAPDTRLSESTQMVQLNVLHQTANLKTNPIVADRIERGELNIYSWFFDLQKAEVQVFEEAVGKFVRVRDDTGAKTADSPPPIPTPKRLI